MNKNNHFHLLGAVIATGILSFSGVLIETAMNVTFPTLIHEFGLSTSKIQWVTTIYLLVIAITIPLSSYFNERFSARKLFLIANLFFLVGVLTNCFSANFAMLLFGRLLQGIGTGIGLPLMFHLILTKAPLHKRGMMMGIGTLTTSIAPAIGPTYGGIIAHALDWRYIYIFLLPLVIISLFLGLAALPREIAKTPKKLAFRQVIALSIMFFAFISALSAEHLLTFALLFVIEMIGAVMFVRFNRKETLIDLGIMKNRRFVALIFSLLVYQALLLGLSFILPSFLQVSAGFSSSAAGIFMFPGALIGAVLAPISGKILDQIGARKPITTGLVLAALGLVLLFVFLPTKSLALLLIAHIVLMLGLGISYSNLMTCSLGTLSTEELSDGNALVNTLQQFIGAVATAVVATTLSLFQGLNGFKTGTSQGTSIILALFFILIIVSLIVSFPNLKKINANH
ncbi:Multidrug resistance protein B, MF superfamily [Lactococcus cremoris]|uniref:MFS transporter n=1 Tax=Lactococcus lactis subsp. cremoris TaxID=1359 RepID=A0A1V0PHM0_LACLC|nr:MFS transporter [Lactococcus cremoris]ARE28774.1 MFS transporter [Lactococcus cremoris]EUN35128.1 MFS transporter [Lactococcus cremoris subsp. cremoris HP]KZK11701.1 Multidrug resistance protein B [Lactococcus cremoris]KZK39435.1 Multidrug resistance protein B [Lactococcus cremoris]KZK46751.1 Multidrug resistance protein B [Lactococcus cremoris]